MVRLARKPPPLAQRQENHVLSLPYIQCISNIGLWTISLAHNHGEIYLKVFSLGFYFKGWNSRCKAYLRSKYNLTNLLESSAFLWRCQIPNFLNSVRGWHQCSFFLWHFWSNLWIFFSSVKLSKLEGIENCQECVLDHNFQLHFRK